MTKALRFMLYGEDRLLEKIDRRKAEQDIRRGSKRYGKIVRNTNGTIRRVKVS